MEIGLLTAFFGGVLALLSPCAAMLMPAFFASTIGTGPRLLLHGAVFYAGLLLVLVPIGLGAGAIGSLFVTHREIIVLVTSALLVVFGILQIFGRGFDPARFLPGAESLQSRAATASGLFKTLLLGAASGIAGFCAGPILGAVLTLAAASGSAFTAGTMLAVYGLGMIAPLLLIAALWRRLGTRGQRLLRGRSFQIGTLRFHTTSVLTGVLLIGVGVVFWTTNGLVSAPSLIPTGMLAWLQESSSVLANPWFDLAAVLGVGIITLLIWWWRGKRSTTSETRA